MKLFSKILRKIKAKKILVPVLAVIGAGITALCVWAVTNPGWGINTWPQGRIGYRLDLHWGQVAQNLPNDADHFGGYGIPLFLDSSCTTQYGEHYLVPTDWVIAYYSNGVFTGKVTYPVTVSLTGTDYGRTYTTHYIRPSDLKYIVSGTGHFNGDGWNQSAWYNGGAAHDTVPSKISYTGKLTVDTGLPNGDTTWVGNNVGGFSVDNDLSLQNYFYLRTGDWSASVMQRENISHYCQYDGADWTDADYFWSLASQDWSTAGLHEGTNEVDIAGMDASGNFMTETKTLRWDTRAPIMATNLNNTAASFSHNGWLNYSDFDNSDTEYVIVSKEDTSVTNDVSGLNLASLQTIFDGVNQFGNDQGYQGFGTTPDSNGNYIKYMSLRATMQAMGVQDDGTGGQGTHTFDFSSIDNAWNTAVIGATVQIDTVPPTATVNPVTGQFNSTADGIALALTFADATSGVDTSSTYYQWVQEGSSPTDSGWQQYTGQTVTQTQKGVWELYYKASDIAGNSMTGHSGPYYCGSLAGYIQNPGTAYTNGQDVIASVYVKSSDSGDITPTNNASVSLTAKDANGNVLTTQTKQLVVPNDEMQLVWYKFHVPADAIGPVSLTATINSSLADAQHNPFGLNVQSGAAAAADFYDDMDDPLPSWVNTSMAAPASTNTSASWQQWSYVNGAFTHNTYTASATASLKITADPDSPSTVKTDPTTGHVTMKSGYPIIEKPTVTVQTNAILDAITGAQSVFSRYPEWNYGYDHANLMTQTSSASDTASKTISGKFDLPENKYVTERLFSQFALDHITEPNFHITPGKFFERSNNYTALITAQDIWTPAGTIEASTTDTVTFNGFLQNEGAPNDTNKHVLGYD